MGIQGKKSFLTHLVIFWTSHIKSHFSKIRQVDISQIKQRKQQSKKGNCFWPTGKKLNKALSFGQLSKFKTRKCLKILDFWLIFWDGHFEISYDLVWETGYDVGSNSEKLIIHNSLKMVQILLFLFLVDLNPY